MATKNIKKILLNKNGDSFVADIEHVVRSVNGINADAQGNVQLGNSGAITGEIKWFAFNTVPDGYIICNGAKVSRETYADLFAAIGTTFGSGDGSTTFNIPDLRDRYIIGANTNALGTYIAEQLPNITGSIGIRNFNADEQGAWSQNGTLFATTNYPNDGINTTPGGPKGHGHTDVTFNASKSNSVYTNNGKVYPLSLALLPCIRY